ncbi:hypothetical protein L21SP5_02417 [Salinivirga cyanobacteriivorans]|uniref:Lipoprotein n=1 Tax=Salinivirga cyanobacteriivorans TaxID=1307839 RepID=A0A0S2I174_9BACT|nr:hypothetical protein [Salinivirga cyanobacteriivorans]ALO16045.1 hypothetical protein L21SP5_02417 [Salinivirga cyanobacteriivorans]
MNKISSLLFSVILICGITACEPDQKNKQKQTQQQKKEITPEPVKKEISQTKLYDGNHDIIKSKL